MDAKQQALLEEIKKLQERYEAVLVRMQVVEAEMHQLQKKVRVVKDGAQRYAAKKLIDSIV